MATNPAPSACMKCGTAHVPGAGFCGSCGTPAGSPGQPQQQAYAPSPPPMPPRFGIPAPQGPGAPVTLLTNVDGALAAAGAAITATRGKVTWQGPNSLTFTSKLSWGNGTFNGTVEAGPLDAGRTSVTVNLTPQYGVIITCVLCGVMMAFMSPGVGMLGLLLGGGFGAYSFYNLTGPGKDGKRQDIMRALQANAPIAPQPGIIMTPPPGAGAMPPPVQATPFEQLRKLAELRDSGAISPADFESAKARILGGL